jgi:hypothetical protein
MKTLARILAAMFGGVLVLIGMLVGGVLLWLTGLLLIWLAFRRGAA